MTQQTIEIEGLPEGWKAVAYRVPNIGEFLLGDDGQVWLVQDEQECKQIIVEKIQLRRLEETDEIRVPDIGEWYESSCGSIVECVGVKYAECKIWREVKE